MAEGVVNSTGPPPPKPHNNDKTVTSVSTAPCFLETTEGRRLAYHRTEGSSPGVVFIHGLNSNMNGDKAMGLELFCKQRGTSFLRFDLSGHGESSLNFKDCNITMWLEDLVSLLKCLTSGSQILVGSSIGGWLMFLYTMRNPDNIHGLIGVGAAPDFTEIVWKGLSKEEKQEVKKSGHCKLHSPYCNEPYELSMNLIMDGSKYCIMDMPGEGREERGGRRGEGGEGREERGGRRGEKLN